MSDFRAFAEDCKGLVEQLVRLVTDDRDIVPMVHYRDASGHVDGQPVDAAWFADAESRRLLVESLIVPYVQILRPESVAWTFTGRRGWTDGFFDHDVAATCVVDRERAEVWEARLVRHDGRASLGAWRQWPVDQAGGVLLSPIQRSLR